MSAGRGTPHSFDPARARSIVIVGEWQWDIYEEGLAKGFASHGWSVIPSRVPDRFSGRTTTALQQRVKAGPVIHRMNERFVRECLRVRPEAIFFFATDLILPGSLGRLKREMPDTVLLAYHNDNPFLGVRNLFKWRHYLAGIPFMDIVLVYRPANTADALKRGAKRVVVLAPYYLTYRHRPPDDPGESKRFDVIFIGHHEHDGRAELLDVLWKHGIHIGVFGTGWERIRGKYPWLDALGPRPARGMEYSRLLASAKMALAFLSKANGDVWTRRCFEIPACRTAMIAPRTVELEAIYAPDREAVYYDSADDLLRKVRFLLQHPEERERIAYAGWRRCVEGGHNEIGRARQVIRLIEENLGSNRVEGVMQCR